MQQWKRSENTWNSSFWKSEEKYFLWKRIMSNTFSQETLFPYFPKDYNKLMNKCLIYK